MGSLSRKSLFWALALFLFCAFQLAAATTGTVDWVYDGDTLKLEGVGKVRLIGIDSPEHESSSRDNYYIKRHQISSNRLRDIAREALAFNIQHVKGRRVTLEFDEQKRDRFGRTLAYVYLPDGRQLNLLLIEKGLASVYRKFDFRRKQEYLAAEERARKSGRGLWKQ